MGWGVERAMGAVRGMRSADRVGLDGWERSGVDWDETVVAG